MKVLFLFISSVSYIKKKNQRKGAAFVIYIVKRFLFQGDALSNKYSVCVQNNLSFN